MRPSGACESSNGTTSRREGALEAEDEMRRKEEGEGMAEAEVEVANWRLLARRIRDWNEEWWILRRLTFSDLAEGAHWGVVLMSLSRSLRSNGAARARSCGSDLRCRQR
uniref:Uncharacterized protein n=1 Tax=Oryza meridionalis TaxID=40149 RepID=A0A0E0EPU9_9ORYZ